MFKFVVLFALVAVAVAKPGAVLHAGITAVAAPVVAYSAPAVAIPAAVSHQSRIDVISKPVVATYAHAPIIEHAPVVAAYAAPAIAYGGIGHGIGYGNGIGYGHGIGYGVGHLGYAGYGHGW